MQELTAHSYLRERSMRRSTESIGLLVLHLLTMRPDCKSLFVAFRP
jgi:hypothetical protein